MEKAGKYTIKEFIASGGMAEIFRGSLAGPHGFVKDVVIKAVHPHLLKDEKYIKLFLREAKLWAKLNHSSIVQVYEFFEEKGRYHLVMEYIKGTDLMNVIKRSAQKGKPLGIPRTIRIFESLLSALEYAHNFRDEEEKIFGIVHRDISPQNILISVSGDVKITDFGIAKASLSTGLTTKGAIIGKIDYMSPEQALGKEVDQRTDIFSAGIVLWETLTGNKLFDGKNDIEVLENVRRCEVIRPSAINPEIDERLEQIIMKSLHFSPENRYQNAQEFRDELRSYLQTYPHKIAEENLSDFMKELFPEYVKNYTHRTELLDDDNETGRQRRNRLPVFIAGFISLLAILAAAIIFYPRPYSAIGEKIDIEARDITGIDLSVPDESSDLFFIRDIATDERDDVKQEIKEAVPTEPTEKAITKHGDTKKRSEIARKGWLSVNAIPWADVYIGKKKIGTTPIFNYELKAGGVEVIFRNNELGVMKKKRLIIEPDKEIRYTEDMTKE